MNTSIDDDDDADMFGEDDKLLNNSSFRDSQPIASETLFDNNTKIIQSNSWFDIFMLPVRIHRGSLFDHGCGVVMYFEFAFFVSLMYLIASIAFIVQWLIDSRSNINWWHGFHPISFTVSLGVFCIMVILFQKRQLRIWAAILHVCKSVSSRSVLVSSPAFRGSLALVPNGADIAKFFANRFGPVDNVLLLLDIGRLVKLYRVNDELQHMCLDTEKLHQRHRPNQGLLSDMICCRQCRNLAKQAAEKKRDRYERWMEKVEGQIKEEQNVNQVESMGCAIVTFDRQDDAIALLGDNESEILFQVRPIEDDDDDDDSVFVDHLKDELAEQQESCWKSCQNRTHAPQDHARDWWFSPSLLSKTRFGEDKKPLFVRMPPEPDDINFESFQRGKNPSTFRWMWVWATGIYCISGGLIGICCGFMLGLFTLDLVGILVVCGFFVFFRFVVYAASLSSSMSNFLPISVFATFSLEQRGRFRIGYIVAACTFAGFLIGLIVFADTALTASVLFWFVCAYQVVSVALTLILPHLLFWSFHKVTGGLQFPLGYFYTESIVSVFITMMTLPWAPHILFVSSILQLFHYLALKVHMLSLSEPVSPKYGPEVSISAVNVLPRVAFVSSFFGFVRSLVKPVDNLMWLSLFSCLGLCLFAILWHYASQSEFFLFRFPSMSGSIQAEIKSGSHSRNPVLKNPTPTPSDADIEQAVPVQRDTTIDISFGTVQSAWQAGLSTKQQRQIVSNKDSYFLPMPQRQIAKAPASDIVL